LTLILKFMTKEKLGINTKAQIISPRKYLPHKDLALLAMCA